MSRLFCTRLLHLRDSESSSNKTQKTKLYVIRVLTLWKFEQKRKRIHWVVMRSRRQTAYFFLISFAFACVLMISNLSNEIEDVVCCPILKQQKDPEYGRVWNKSSRPRWPCFTNIHFDWRRDCEYSTSPNAQTLLVISIFVTINTWSVLIFDVLSNRSVIQRTINLSNSYRGQFVSLPRPEW